MGYGMYLHLQEGNALPAPQRKELDTFVVQIAYYKRHLDEALACYTAAVSRLTSHVQEN
jgi:hypothetical protein